MGIDYISTLNIIVNPDDLGRLVGLNLLKIPEGLVGDELLDVQHFITETVISIIYKDFSSDDSGVTGLNIHCVIPSKLL